MREDAVELAAMSWFELAGWRSVPGADLAPGGAMGARSSYAQALLEPELRSALASLNPDATPGMIDQGVRAVLSVPSQDLLTNNAAFHAQLATGVRVETVENGERKWVGLRLLDRENPHNNRLLVANQFVFDNDRRERIRADLVAFVNGIPVALLELKSPSDASATLARAHTQLQNYKAAGPELLRFNQVLVISDGVSARIGSLTAGLDRFAPWRTVDGNTLQDEGRAELEVLIRGVFAPERFLDLIVDYVALETADGAIRSKKLAGYHQFHAVRKALASTVRAAGEGGGRKGGVIWHTQGSGKSLTMLFFVRQLQLAKPLRNPTIVLVTDRNDLDDQLFGTFCAHGSALRVQPQRAESAADMRRLLRVDIGGVVFTAIQKFRGEEGDRPLLTERSNVVVIADEAHRTQYGIGKRFVVGDDAVREQVGFAEYLRQALPSATFVGFTGTPIAERDRDTRGVFGDVIDTYDMSQSVADKATVPIHYTARLARLHLNLSDEERAELDALAEQLVEGDEAALERDKARLARFEQVVGAPGRLSEVASDIVQHFEARREAMGGGKAMIVAVSRQAAVDIYGYIAALRPAWTGGGSADDKAGVLKVVITGQGSSDPVAFQPHLRSKARREALADRFKDPTSGFDLVIVRDMWLTGFDAPSLHTLYIDKPMRGHGLMQAIARVNRVWGDKPGGLVVDYLGIGAELQAALRAYSARDRDQVRLDLDQAVRIALTRLEGAQALLGDAPWKDFFGSDPSRRLSILKQCLETLLSTQRRDEFIKIATELEAAYALCAGDERIAARRDEVALMAAIRANLSKYTMGSGRGQADVEHALKQLLSRAVMADGILDVFASAGLDTPDLSVLSEEFLAEVSQTEQKSLAVETLRRLLAGHIKARERSNLVQARHMGERLDETLRRYHNRAVDSVQVIEELLALARDISADAARGTELGLSDEELAFYDALAENGSAKALMEHEQLRVLARMLAETIRSSAALDWTEKESVRARMRVEVCKLLAKYGYPPDLQKDAVDLVIQQAESLAHRWKA